MTDADLAHVRQGIEDIKVAIAVHDSNATHYVERIVSAEERVAEAVTKMAESTVEIKAAVVQLGKNGNGRGIQLDRKTLMWLLGLALAGATAIGGGQELAHRLAHSLLNMPDAASEKGEAP